MKGLRIVGIILLFLIVLVVFIILHMAFGVPLVSFKAFVFGVPALLMLLAWLGKKVRQRGNRGRRNGNCLMEQNEDKNKEVRTVW